jgi:nickel transport protein
MKLLIQSSLILSLAGSTLLLPSFIGSSEKLFSPAAHAIALTNQDVMQRLRGVPVFTITDAQGKPLLAAKAGSQKKQNGLFFLSQQDAQALLKQIKAQKPELNKSARVTIVGLDRAYELVQLGQAKKQTSADQAVFFLQPQVKQVQSAIKLLQASGQKIEQLNAVPIFFAVVGEKQNLLTIQKQDKQIIPLFFSKEDLDRLLQQVRQKNPKLAATVKVKVGSLDQAIQLMKESNDAESGKIAFIPPQESLDFLRLQQSSAPRK